jgi:hypothetical protein
MIQLNLNLTPIFFIYNLNAESESEIKFNQFNLLILPYSKTFIQHFFLKDK